MIVKGWARTGEGVLGVVSASVVWSLFWFLPFLDDFLAGGIVGPALLSWTGIQMQKHYRQDFQK